MKIFLESIEDVNNFVKHWNSNPIILESVPIQIQKSEKKKSVKKDKPKTVKPKTDSKWFVIPSSVKTKYDLKWSDADWHILKYKYGQGYKECEYTLLDLYFLNSFNGKITNTEIKTLSRAMGLSENKIAKIIYNLTIGTYRNYFKVVDKATKNISVDVLRNECIMINGVKTDLKRFDAYTLIVGIQNAPNKARYIHKSYKQYENCLSIKNYVLLCSNYANGKLSNLLKTGGI